MTEQIPLRETARLITQAVNEAASTAERVRSLGYEIQLAPELRSDREPFVCEVRGPEASERRTDLFGSIRACQDDVVATVDVEVEIEGPSGLELVLAAEVRYEAGRDYPQLIIFMHRRHAPALRRYLELPEIADEEQRFFRVLRDIYPSFALGVHEGERFLSLTEKILLLLRGSAQELVDALHN